MLVREEPKSYEIGKTWTASTVTGGTEVKLWRALLRDALFQNLLLQLAC